MVSVKAINLSNIYRYLLLFNETLESQLKGFLPICKLCSHAEGSVSSFS